MIDRFGVQRPMIFGALITIIATIMMAGLGTTSSLFYVLICLFLAGMGLGAYFTGCNTAMLWAAPQKDLNVASGVYMMFMMMGNTLSIVLATSLVVLVGRNFLFKTAQKQGIELTPQQHQDLAEIISKVEHSASQLKDFPTDQVPQLLQWVDSAFVYGLSFNMMVGAFFALIATGLTVWGVGRLKPPAAQTQHAAVGI